MSRLPSREERSEIEYLRNLYRLCRHKRWLRDGRPIPCRSPRCPSAECRRQWARKESAILCYSFRQKPPDFLLTLGVVGTSLTADQTARYLKGLTQRVRDYRKSAGVAIEYDVRIEFVRGRPHAHLTIIHPARLTVFKMKQLIRGWWVASCEGRRVSDYCRRVRSAVALARYVTKNLNNRAGVEMPPAGWDGRHCRLVWTSAKFLTLSKKVIWRKLIEEWFPTADEESR